MVSLGDLKEFVVLLALIALIGASTAIALSDFRATTTVDTSEYNITTNGLTGVDNATNYLGTTGTIAGIAVLIGVVLAAFSFVRR